MVLDNYVAFEDGASKRLHFTADHLGDRPVRDPLLGVEKMLTVLVLQVDEEDGQPVAKLLSITSQNFAAQLAGYLPNQLYRGYDFIITRRGTGFGIKYTVIAIPRS